MKNFKSQIWGGNSGYIINTDNLKEKQHNFRERSRSGHFSTGYINEISLWQASPGGSDTSQ